MDSHSFWKIRTVKRQTNLILDDLNYQMTFGKHKLFQATTLFFLHCSFSSCCIQNRLHPRSMRTLLTWLCLDVKISIHYLTAILQTLGLIYTIEQIWLFLVLESSTSKKTSLSSTPDFFLCSSYWSFILNLNSQSAKSTPVQYHIAFILGKILSIILLDFVV